MPGLNELIERLSQDTNNNNAEQFAKQLLATQEYLLSLTDIRILISDSRNFGHQASSVNILMNLIRLGSQAEFTLGLATENESLINKMKVLLPQFKEVYTPFEIEGRTVQVFPLNIKLTPDGPFGITGGFDDDKMPPLQNLNVKSYLQLQPYGWPAGSNLILQGNNPPIDLDSTDLNLRRRAFFLADPVVTTDDWKAIADSPWKDKAPIVRFLLDSAASAIIRLCPVYGIHTKNTYPEVLLYNMVSGILQAQEEGVPKADTPAVVPVIQNFPLEHWAYFEQYVQTGRRDNPPTVALNPSPSFTEWHSKVAVAKRVKVLWSQVTPQMVEQETKTLQPGQILVVNLGTPIGNKQSVGLPMVLYNALFGQATLPPLFEGQNTVELMINLGRPYFKILANSPEEETASYPTLPITTEGLSAEVLLANRISYYGIPTFPQSWNPESDFFPPKWNVQMIRAVLAPDSTSEARDLSVYFTSLRGYFHKEENDKLLLALNYLVNVAHPVGLELIKTESLALAAETPLQQLYADLEANLHDGVIDLLRAITSGVFYTFFKQAVDDSFFRVTSATLSINEQQTEIDLNGETTAFGVGRTAVSFTFVQPGESIDSILEASFLEASWGFPGAPWLSVSAPGLALTIREGGTIPVTGKIKARVTAGFTMEMALTLPAAPGKLQLQASFPDDPPSVSSVFQMVGGIDLTAFLPPQLAILADIGVRSFELQYDYAQGRMDFFSLQMGSDGQWSLVPGIEITDLRFKTLVNLPGDVRRRTTSYQIGGDFAIGGGSAYVNAQTPGLAVQGGLKEDSKPVSLDALIGQFLGTQPVPIHAEIDKLSFALNSQLQTYSFACGVTTDWPIAIGGTTLFTITGLNFNIDSTQKSNTGSFGGVTRILPDDPDVNVELSVTAAYGGTEAGWTFVGRQTGGQVPLGKLLAYYLGPAWSTDQTYGIDGLSLTIETATSSYTFTGKTAEPWVIPIDTGITIFGNAKLGYRARPKPPVPAGLFGELSARIQWRGIDLTVFYNFDPTYNSFGIIWGIVTGKIEEKLINGQVHKIASLTLANQTVGSIVETFISWATGQPFGLAAPWSLLSSVPLSAFALQFDFTTSQVSFQIGLGPINLGFARIDSISVRYESDPANKGVIVELKGSFFWQSDPSQPLSWDAAKPETTPAPPGNGNKYLDLRLLALGQHVAIGGSQDFTSVQQAIAAMSQLAVPKGGQIPVGGTPAPGQPYFDPESSWLIGADFGVLKLEPAPAPPKAAYFLTLQTVFNDPHLYALRLALEGAPAKIFAGLDFQILYRQVSDTVGVYQAEIALPTAMRRLSVGAYTIILPVFGIAVYTNGDFQVDVGFPWKEDFSRSFTVEAIIYPGIPVIGSAGFYFGKLSSASTQRVPAAGNGTFNPVIVFGFGAQVGLGKSIEYGILKAGFSLTAFGIIEGILAKWNPYQLTDGGDSGDSQLQGQYYFWLRGTLGLQGRLYGSVDFAIVKAEVNVQVKVYVQITFESYAPIPITVVALVDVSASVKIDLGLFSIRISFSFSARIKETFTLLNGGTPPWHVTSGAAGLLAAPATARLRAFREMDRAAAKLAAAPAPDWSNLEKPEQPAPLTGYLAPALTVAGDEAATTAEQIPCYVNLLFIDSVPAASEDRTSSVLKAAGAAADTPFEILVKQVLRWAIAAIQPGPVTAEEVDGLVVSDEQLTSLLDGLSDPANRTPIPAAALEAFLSDQFVLTVRQPSGSGGTDATIFPMAAGLQLDVPAYGGQPALSYTFAGYNSIDPDYLATLRRYFDELSVHVETEEQRAQRLAVQTLAADEGPSVASFVFGDYFLLLLRQMLQAAREGLRSFKYPIPADSTVQAIIDKVNEAGDLGGAFTALDLFSANPAHALTAGKEVSIAGAAYQALASDTFASIAGQPVWSGGFTAAQLATANAEATAILTIGAKIAYPGKPEYTVQPGDSLSAVAATLGVSLADLLANSGVLEQAGLLAALAVLAVPAFLLETADGDTLQSLAARFAVSLADLAGDAHNTGEITGLFSAAADPDLDLAHLPQFQVGQLIAEAQRTLALQHLSGMASRYSLYGLRLPTGDGQGSGITPNVQGIFVKDNGGKLTLPPSLGLYALTGQEIRIPPIQKDAPFTFSFTRPSGLSWLAFAGSDPSRLEFSIAADSTDGQRIQTVAGFAQSNLLDLDVRTLGPQPLVSRQAASYALANPAIWQSASPVTLPYGSPPDGVPSLRLWSSPDVLINLPDPATRAVNPRLALRVGTYDEASGTMVETPVASYGWATSIPFNLKRIPTIAGSPATVTTYEISGATDTGILLLERLLSQLGDDDSAYFRLTLAYSPDPAGQAPGGLQSDSAGVRMGITQVNLSTETRPPAGAFAAKTLAEEPEPFPGLYNEPSDFLRLLWEASITRSGGFFLYYFDAESGEGLPARIFNDKGEASVTLLVIYPKPADAADQNRLANFINGAVTGEAIDTTNSVVFAVADPVPAEIEVEDGDVPAEVAQAWFMNVADLFEDNAGLALTSDKTVTVTNGLYEVPPAGVAPGGQLADIAKYFGVSEQAIRDANPRIIDWSQPLPLFTAIRLPEISVTVGTSPGGTTLAGISTYYGADLAGLAAANQGKAGLFATGQSFQISGGPYLRTANVAPGISSFEAKRPVPPAVPSDPTSEGYGEIFLQNVFTLLGWRIADNQDFRTSNMGLPAGPVTQPEEGSAAQKVRAARLLAPGEIWDYQQSLRYPGSYKQPALKTVAGLPDPTASPYTGVGGLLQIDFEWQDLYGNKILTTLSNPPAGDRGPLNRPPILTGYTDALYGLNQWPSVSYAWQVLPGAQGAAPSLIAGLSFDASRYDPSSTVPDVPVALADDTPAWQQNARRDLEVYTQIFYQLHDPNGIALSIATSLLDGVLPIEGSELQSLFDWLESIYRFLADRAGGGLTVEPPAPLALENAIDTVKLNPASIFELTASFAIARTGGFVADDFQTTPGIRSTAAGLPPRTEAIAGTADSTGTLGLEKFAADFEAALSVAGQVLLKVATGSERSRISQSAGGRPVWAVRLGLNPQQGISYEIANPGNPKVFAPRPISNQLESRTQVPIYDYVPGQGIDFSQPSRRIDFTGIDMDLWGRQFLGAVDGVLSPAFVVPTQIVGDAEGEDYLGQLLAQKKALAGLIKEWMIPVYSGETATAAELQAIQDTFEQQLLVLLSNAYATRAGLEFQADVNAGVPPVSGDPVPPRLFGNVVQNASAEPEARSNVNLTSPKLELKTSTPDDPRLLAFLLSSGGLAGSVDLDLSYDGFAIEHEIGKLPGIEGYEASSWLSFVLPPGSRGPLAASLGSFPVPLVLRSFPALPSMTRQTGQESAAVSSDPLDGATLWTYSFTYTQDFHYPQDRVYANVQFNLADPSRVNAFVSLEDAFPALAELITVFPEVDKDLVGILAGIDATTRDPEVIRNAGIALQSFLELVGRTLEASQSANFQMARAATPAGTGEPYQFFVQEGSAEVQEGDRTVTALQVQIHGLPPAGIGTPTVEISGYDSVSSQGPGDFNYLFTNKSSGLYLSQADGQAIPDRTVVLPEMDVLARQDAWASVLIKRNEELVSGKPSAEPFVYTTSPVRFAAPFHPTLDHDQVIDIAALAEPVRDSFEAQLGKLFQALLAGNSQETLTFQISLAYDYAVNAGLDPITLPVYLLPPTPVDVQEGTAASLTLSQLITGLAQSARLWFDTNTPQPTEGTLWFDLTIFSSLTAQPMPLLRLRRLQLKIEDVVPPLTTG